MQTFGANKGNARRNVKVFIIAADKAGNEIAGKKWTKRNPAGRVEQEDPQCQWIKRTSWGMKDMKIKYTFLLNGN